MLFLWTFNLNIMWLDIFYILPKSCIQENNTSQTPSCDGCTYLFLLTTNINIMLINFTLKCTLVITVVFQLRTGPILLAHLLLQKVSSIFYNAEYIFNNVKPPCHIVPVVWKLFLARSCLPFFSHKLCPLLVACHHQKVLQKFLIEEILHCQSDRAPAQVAQGSRSVSVYGGIQDPSGQLM